MQLGAVLSQNEINDIAALRDYAQAVQELGFDFLVAADHVVGSEKAAHPELERVYPIENVLHEPLALFAHLAAAAPRLGFLTSVIILPQRQATMVAKQAAEVDIMCGGRFRLGVGIGWNPVEFDALGMTFKNRARRFEEQVTVIRRLSSERTVTLDGRYHSLQAAGINPRPVQQPLPIWFGAHVEPAIKRACAIGDGWLPLRPLDGGWDATMERVNGWLRDAGRDAASFGIEGRLEANEGTPDDWRKSAEMWRRFNASHLSVGTGGVGGPDEHVKRLRAVRAAIAP